jgi:hypothetical protein
MLCENFFNTAMYYRPKKQKQLLENFFNIMMCCHRKEIKATA